jgi:hypothetical protein
MEGTATTPCDQDSRRIEYCINELIASKNASGRRSEFWERSKNADPRVEVVEIRRLMLDGVSRGRTERGRAK